MVIQNLNTIYSNRFLKSDHVVVSVSSRLSLEEIYERLVKESLSPEDAEILVFKRAEEEGPLYELFLPPYGATSGWDKVSSSEFEKFLAKQEGFADCFVELPVVVTGEESTKEAFVPAKDLLPYFSAALGILPELEEKELSLEEKKRLSEMCSLFYRDLAPIEPTNAPPRYEDLQLFQSLSLYEQRVVRQWAIDLTRSEDDDVVNNAAQAKITPKQLDFIRYCKTPSLNGYGMIPITEELTHNLRWRKRETGETAVKRFANVDAHILSDLGLEDVSYPDDMLRFITTTLSNEGNLTESGAYNIKMVLNNFSRSMLYTTKQGDINSQNTEEKFRFIKDTLLRSGVIFSTEDLVQMMNSPMLPASAEDLANLRAEELAYVFLEQSDTSEQALKEFVKKTASERYPKQEDILLSELESLFVNSKHRRAPRISYEILRAFQYQKQRTVTKEELKEIVENFSLNSFKKIAGAHSVNLMNLSRYMDLSAMKSAHLDIFTVKALDIKRLSKTGFFDWYNAHKNVTPSELFELLSEDKVEQYDKQFSAKDLIRRGKMKTSYEEVKRIEEGWGIQFADNDVAVQGREIVVSDNHWTAEICDKDDPRQTTSGIDTSCCQRFGGAGGSCVKDILTNPLSCNLIITDNETGRIEAQSYIWSDPSKDALVLDNIEFRPEHDRSTKKFLPLLAAWCQQMPQKNIQVGTGYNDSFVGVGSKVSANDVCHRIVLNQMENVYSDYHTSGAHTARILKKGGVLTISPSRHAIVRRKELLPSALEAICPPHDFSRLAIPGVRSAEDYNEFKRKAADASNEEWIREAIAQAIQRKDTSYIDLFAMVPEEQQQLLFDIDSSVVRNIKNPTSSVLSKYLALNPAEVQNYPNLDTSIIKHSYAQNGLLVRKVPTNNRECQKAAVNSEPLAVIYLKNSPIFEELLEMAIKKNPSIMKFFPQADNKFWNKAVWRDPFIIRYIKNPTSWQKKTAIEKNPAVVYSIRNANKQDFALADQILAQKKTEEKVKQQSSRRDDEQFNPFLQMAH